MFQGIAEIFLIFLAGANFATAIYWFSKNKKVAIFLLVLSVASLSMSWYAIKLIVLLRSFNG